MQAYPHQLEAVFVRGCLPPARGHPSRPRQGDRD